MQYWMNQCLFFWNDFFSKKICLFSVSEDAQPARFCAEYWVWAKLNKCFWSRICKKQIQKIASWYQLALFAAVTNSKIFVQKNNRPLQVELENGRSRLQNDFQILEERWEVSQYPPQAGQTYIQRLHLQAMCLSIQTPFALQNACWAVPKPLVFCIRWMQAVLSK